MIKLRDLTFRYTDQLPVLEALDFHLAEGEKIGLVGPNGAGKTTLFHLIVGLLAPTSGEIEIFGQPRREERDFWEVRERIGFLFQDPDDQLFCPTVGEDVAFGPLNLGKSREEVRQIAHQTLQLLSLEHLEERVTHHLSGGEKRLASLATVLAMEPTALLLDEPTAGLAEEMIERVSEVLENHVQTCIIISHNRPFLERNVNRIYRMAEGKISPL
jgi:cobalt/nickel transport system ATP-binding protein